jgi:hypothetical protein
MTLNQLAQLYLLTLNKGSRNMPMLIEHIDAIARKKQRDVLYLTFHPKGSTGIDWWDNDSYNWQQDPMRETVCNWLTEHHIAWQPCGYFANENSMCALIGKFIWTYLTMITIRYMCWHAIISRTPMAPCALTR